MLDSESQTLKDILIGDNLITEEQMKEVEEEQERNGKSLKEVIIDFGILTEADILEAIGRSLGLTAVRHACSVSFRFRSTGPR